MMMLLPRLAQLKEASRLGLQSRLELYGICNGGGPDACAGAAAHETRGLQSDTALCGNHQNQDSRRQMGCSLSHG